MLGFRGHFSTKSRAYSITLGSLRTDRAAYQREQAITAGLQPDIRSDTTIVLTDWHFAGHANSLANSPGSLDLPSDNHPDLLREEGVGDVA
jgi:hypothetical protein